MKQNPPLKGTAEAPEYLKAEKPVAILVDGGFFLHRYRYCFGDLYIDGPYKVAKNLHGMLLKHVEKEKLYRILQKVASNTHQSFMQPTGLSVIVGGDKKRPPRQRPWILDSSSLSFPQAFSGNPGSFVFVTTGHKQRRWMPDRAGHDSRKRRG